MFPFPSGLRPHSAVVISKYSNEKRGLWAWKNPRLGRMHMHLALQPILTAAVRYTKARTLSRSHGGRVDKPASTYKRIMAD